MKSVSFSYLRFLPLQEKLDFKYELGSPQVCYIAGWYILHGPQSSLKLQALVYMLELFKVCQTGQLLHFKGLYY